MRGSKTVIRRFLRHRAERWFDKNRAPGDGKEAAQPLDAPAIDRPPEPTLREIISVILTIIFPGDMRRAASAVPEIVRPRPLHDKAKRANFVIMTLLSGDVLLGAAIGLIGFFDLGSNVIALIGAGFATGGILFMVIFQLAGRER